MRALYQNIFDNPILTRELRRRMRGKALVYSIIGYIILMTLVSILILLAKMDPFTTAQAGSQDLLQKLAETGSLLFQSIILLQALLVLIIAPTITAGMTTGEKEKKTFDFLRVTTITPWMYITGCFLSTVFYVSLALLCALPLISLAFLYGGIGAHNVVQMGGVLLGLSMVLSAFGLLISSVRERTRTAQGIVVFMIFSLIFGGAIIYSQIAIWLGTTTAAAAGNPAAGPTAGAGIVMFGYQVPSWVLIVMGILGLTIVFLLVATRKLFDPDESRAFSHWQFAFIAGATMAVLLGSQAGSVLKDTDALLFLTVGMVLLATAVTSFAVGRMEVGDEIWHMKRLLPFLRPFDQTVPYLILLGFAWYFIVDMWRSSLAGYSAGALKGMIDAVLLVSLFSYGFFVVFGRFATAVTVGRKGAGRLTLAVIGTCWIALPILGALLKAMFAVENGGVGYWILSSIERFSPFYAMIEGINDKSGLFTTNLRTICLEYMIPLIAYGTAALGFLIVGEYKRFKRWRRFDYHYDMPAA